jgi:hypothetical protein
MSQATADIVGTTGAQLTLTLDSGSIVAASLRITGQPIVDLAVGADERTVTVTSVPSGESWVHLDIVWAPGDKDAVIGVSSSNATAAQPPHTIDAGDTPGFVELFGT